MATGTPTSKRNLCVSSGEFLNTDLRKDSPFPYSVEQANAERVQRDKAPSHMCVKVVVRNRRSPP